MLHLLEPLTRQYFDEFQQCPQCSQMYWKGSHHARMLALIQSVIPKEPADGATIPPAKHV